MKRKGVQLTFKAVAVVIGNLVAKFFVIVFSLNGSRKEVETDEGFSLGRVWQGYNCT